MNSILTVLIVDDDKRMTRTLADILNLSGFKAVESSSAQEALKLLETQAFDCVLTDVRMPDMNGVEFHRQLRAAYPGLPVLLMTAFASNEIIQQGLDDGVVGVLDKPLDITHLLGFFSSLARQRVVAIVDDDPIFCKTLGDILTQRGFNVLPITDPHSSVETMTSGAQVILLDMRLNSISGLDVMRDVRAVYPSLPVMMVTGYGQEMAGALQAAMDINAFTCLYKPLEIPHLLDLLANIQLTRLRSALKA